MFDSVLTSSVQWLRVRQHQIWKPPTDVYETDFCIVVKIEIAGLRREDFTISLADRVLTVRGVRRDPTSELASQQLAYQQLEINYGEFQTEVYLPQPVNEKGEIEATYEQGFLTILLPKAEAHRVPVTERNRTT